MKNLALIFATIIFLGTSCQSSDPMILSGETQICQMSDDRGLSYVEFGPGDGLPVFYFHGFPGSHKDIQLFKGDELAEQLNLRIIAVNRPGYSDSDPKAGRSLSDWSADIIELADHLQIEKFSILGYSGGAPFALSCGYSFPERLEKLVIVSGMTPVDAPEAKNGKAMVIPKAPKLILKGMSKMMLKKPEKMEANMRKGFPEVDRAVLTDVQEDLTTTMEEALRTGYQGALDDAKIYKTSWGFDLAQIQAPVTLWHGGKDENVLVSSAEYTIDQLPHCTPILKQEEGHLSLIVRHVEEILGTFLEP